MATSSPPLRPEMLELLRKNSSSKFFIEYKGFFSNHLAHGLFALDRLGAPLDKCQDFTKWHIKNKLEDGTRHKKREDQDEPKPADAIELLGARKSYYHIYDYYVNLLENKYGSSLEDLLSEEFPKLSNGLVGSALHGMIHLGYGYASRESWFVCEGLAYLHHSNAPLVLSDNAPGIQTLGLGTVSILAMLDELREDKALIEFMHEAIKEEQIAKMVTGNFQRKTRVLLKHRGDKLAEYCHKIEFPKKLNAKDLTMQDTARLAKWLVDCAITVYAIAEEPNDFFLLHGVTGAWALRNVMILLKNELDVLHATRSFITALFATYLAVDYPALKLDLLKENNGLDHSWESLIQKSVNHENFTEEHIHKMVQVCKEMSEDDLSGDMEALYRLAAYRCLTNPFKI